MPIDFVAQTGKLAQANLLPRILQTTGTTGRTDTHPDGKTITGTTTGPYRKNELSAPAITGDRIATFTV
jgi:hypothetical protein